MRRFAYSVPPSNIKNYFLRISGIDVKSDVFVGDSVRFIDGFLKNSITLEDNSVIAPNSVLISCSYPEKSKSASLMRFSKQENIVISRNVWIGAKTVILPGCNVGEHSIIGAGSVLTKQVGSNEIWAGNPAKFCKKVENEN